MVLKTSKQTDKYFSASFERKIFRERRRSDFLLHSTYKLKSILESVEENVLLNNLYYLASCSAAAVNETKQSKFFKALCRSFISADNPFNKLSNPILRQFLEMYTELDVPEQIALWKNYAPKQYQEELSEIQKKLKSKYIWAAMDEVTDKAKRSVAAVFVGVLDGVAYESLYLIHLEELE